MTLPTNKIIQGDCLEVLKTLPDKSVGAIITDPPYGVRKKENRDNRENFLKQCNEWLDECLRVSGGVVVWFCASQMLPYLLKDREHQFHRMLIWNKPKGSQYAGAMHSNLWYSMEPILIFGTHPKTNKQKKYGYSVFDYRTIPQKTYGHPTTKPIDLMKDLIYFYSNEGDTILDPFLGSGTTAVAAQILNRNYIGIELNPEYIKIAEARLCPQP